MYYVDMLDGGNYESTNGEPFEEGYAYEEEAYGVKLRNMDEAKKFMREYAEKYNIHYEEK